MTPQEFYKLCQAHDWFFVYSDDGSVYRAGEAAEKRLQELVSFQPELKPILVSWSKHMFNGPAWGTEPVPKPEMPQ